MKIIYSFICSFIYILVTMNLSFGFIVNGSQVQSNEDYPFIVKLSSGCAGAIIDKRWVLTAAHCEKGIHSLVAGEIDLNNISGPVVKSYAQYRGVSQRISHPLYKRLRNPIFGSVEYDFQLLKLNKDLVLNAQNVSKIKLTSVNDSNEFLKTNEMFKVIGWGATDKSGYGQSKVLNELDVPFISYAESNAVDAYSGVINPKLMITAGFMDGGKDACHGDSGGPFFKSVNGAYKLFGIVSGGKGCAQKNKPGVYSKVAVALDWIKETIESESECSVGGNKISVFKYKENSVQKIRININNNPTLYMNYHKTKRGNILFKNSNGPTAMLSKDSSYIKIEFNRKKQYSCKLLKYHYVE